MSTAKETAARVTERSVTAPGYKSLLDVYKEYVVPAVESMKKTLGDYYGERCEFTVTKRPTFVKWLEEHDKGSTSANQAFFKRCLRGVENACHSMRILSAYTIIIHFPKLTVRNSQNRKQDITDVWVKMELSPLLNDIQQSQFFRGMRTSYTLAEFSSDYNFSHMQSNPSHFSWSHMCLGDTHFATLCRSLAIEFNANFFALFCQQLADYFSWESLEGGPYKRLSNVHERGNHSSVSIGSGIKDTYYKAYLSSGHIPNVELKSNDFYHVFEVVEDDEFRAAVTKVVTNDTHLQYWDSERKVASDRSLMNRRATMEDYMSRYGRDVRLIFKGQDIKFVLTDMATKEEKDDKVKVAHQTILSHVVGNLNRSLLKNIKDEFSKRRVYVTR